MKLSDLFSGSFLFNLCCIPLGGVFFVVELALNKGWEGAISRFYL